MGPYTHALYKKEKVKRKIWSRIGFFLCLGMLLYPLAASMWNRYHSSLIAARYEKAVADKPDAYKEEWEKAQEYNAELVKTTHCVITSAEYEKDDTYESMLNAGGMMGYVEIPSIQVKEAIYHYSSDDVLQEGIGHIHGSSLPVGGETSHCVLTGHCGLPTQKFFTDLDKVNLSAGKTYILHEKEAPKGYDYAEDIAIVVTADGAVTVDGKAADTVTMADIPLASLPNSGAAGTPGGPSWRPYAGWPSRPGPAGRKRKGRGTGQERNSAAGKCGKQKRAGLVTGLPFCCPDNGGNFRKTKTKTAIYKKEAAKEDQTP